MCKYWKFRWYVLEIETNQQFNDSTQAFAAGYIEANLTSGKIYYIF